MDISSLKLDNNHNSLVLHYELKPPGKLSKTGYGISLVGVANRFRKLSHTCVCVCVYITSRKVGHIIDVFGCAQQRCTMMFDKHELARRNDFHPLHGRASDWRLCCIIPLVLLMWTHKFI